MEDFIMLSLCQLLIILEYFSMEYMSYYIYVVWAWAGDAIVYLDKDNALTCQQHTYNRYIQFNSTLIV